jgi:hypothetical protein
MQRRPFRASEQTALTEKTMSNADIAAKLQALAAWALAHPELTVTYATAGAGTGTHITLSDAALDVPGIAWTDNGTAPRSDGMAPFRMLDATVDGMRVACFPDVVVPPVAPDVVLDQPVHYCAASGCPGYPWRASNHPHPPSCNERAPLPDPAPAPPEDVVLTGCGHDGHVELVPGCAACDAYASFPF